MFEIKKQHSIEGVLDFYLAVITYRKVNKQLSHDIALWAFNTITPQDTSFVWPEWLKKIRFEVGALEAPGTFDGDNVPKRCADQVSFEDFLWKRLEDLLLKRKRFSDNESTTVILGTMSDDKLRYFKSAAKRHLRYDKIIPVSVESGVSEQPMGLTEIQTGADNRARSAFNSSKLTTKIGVGLEGGLAKKGDKFYLLCAATIYDGNFYRGVSREILLPTVVSQKIAAGAEFGVEIRKYQPKTKEKALVNELISREQPFKTAINQSINNFLHAKE